MEYRIDEKVLEKAIEYYGIREQLDVRQEERAEFIQVCSKQKRGKGVKEDSASEIADLLIMIAQVTKMVNLTQADIQRRIDYKIKRLDDNINFERELRELAGGYSREI